MLALLLVASSSLATGERTYIYISRMARGVDRRIYIHIYIYIHVYIYTYIHIYVQNGKR